MVWLLMTCLVFAVVAVRINRKIDRIEAAGLKFNMRTWTRVCRLEHPGDVTPISWADFPEFTSTIRNTQPYGANVDAIAQHTSVREGSD